MTKTSNFQLNQWESTDPIRREDFNADNVAIDTALGSLNTDIGQIVVPKIATGTYKGTGEDKTQAVTLNFRPKAVIAWGVKSEVLQAETKLYNAMAVDGTAYTNALEITDTGFTAMNVCSSMSGQYYPDLNSKGMTYLYFAIG